MSQGNRNHLKMNQEFFKNLPSEIVIDILSRLPVRTVISCKCVQKSWLHLLETQEFVKLHLSKSVSGLALVEFDEPSHLYNFFEIEDGLNVEHHDLHYKLVTEFNLTGHGWIMGSTDGLLFLYQPGSPSICNPITRDYIHLHHPQDSEDSNHQVVAWGFGSSKMTSQYKVVRIFHDNIRKQNSRKWQKTFKVECHVYTLGTGLWRSQASCTMLVYKDLKAGVFANGNLHWLVCDLDRCLRISCFDLETEHFSTLSAPPLHWDGDSFSLYALNLFVLGDCICVCDNTSEDEIVIWVMKKYGVQTSWTKEFVMSNVPKVGELEDCDPPVTVHPIKVFRDGDILFDWDASLLIYYSNKTKTMQTVDMFKRPYENLISAQLFTPSFLSLKTFGIENVTSF